MSGSLPRRPSNREMAADAHYSGNTLEDMVMTAAISPNLNQKDTKKREEAFTQLRKLASTHKQLCWIYAASSKTLFEVLPTCRLDELLILVSCR